MNNLILGDCIEEMWKMQDKVIDLTVTSPPYDNLRTYEGSLQWNEDIWQSVIKQLYRITKDGGVVVWVVGDATIKGSETGTSFKQALYAKEVGFNLHDTMVWCKTKMPQNHNRYEQGFEYMFIWSKGKPKTFNGIRDKKNVEAGATAHASYRDKDGIVKKTSSFNKTKIAEFGLRTNLWFIKPCLGSKDRHGHPAPFSEDLAHDHIISWSNEGDTVFDPFLGSGTTGKMAKQLKREFIGIECVPEYLEIAKKRINV